MRVLMWEHFAPGGPLRVGGHHLADRFLRLGWRVAWCAGPVSPANFVKASEESRRRLRLWRKGGEWLRDGALFAYAPLTLLPYRPYPLLDRRAVQRLTLRATLPGWRGVLARAGFPSVDILWMSPGSPFLALLDDVPHATSVYRMSDLTHGFADAPRGFAALEAEACRRATLVVATARSLEARALALGARRVVYLPNACDPEPFLAAAGAEPGDLRSRPRPRAIYVGAVDAWFDEGLVAEAARLLPEWSFVIVGPLRGRLARLRALANVALLGPRPYDSLPRYLLHADAAIVPFRLDAMTDAIHPIKVYEYCAAGLPVVATPMRETARMGAPVRLAADAAGFAAALRESLAGTAAERDARRAYARAHTWDRRFADLLPHLTEAEAPGTGRAAAGSGGAR